MTLFRYFCYVISFRVNNGSSSQTARTCTNASSIALFLQLSTFTLTSIPAGFGTQLRSVLLRVSFCTLVFSLPLQLSRLFLTYQTYQLRISPMKSILISTKNERRFSHSLRNYSSSASCDQLIKSRIRKLFTVSKQNNVYGRGRTADIQACMRFFYYFVFSFQKICPPAPPTFATVAAIRAAAWRSTNDTASGVHMRSSHAVQKPALVPAYQTIRHNTSVCSLRCSRTAVIAKLQRCANTTS